LTEPKKRAWQGLGPEIGINKESQAAWQYNTIFQKQTISQKTCLSVGFMLQKKGRNPI